jgi:hypothetical protein
VKMPSSSLLSLLRCAQRFSYYTKVIVTSAAPAAILLLTVLLFLLPRYIFDS